MMKFGSYYFLLVLNVFFLFVTTGIAQTSDFNADDARWDDVFKLAGIDYYVDAVEVAPNGNIYVGGIFDLVDGIAVNNIARWDGQEWSNVGAVKDYGVNAISAHNDLVYAGGQFIIAGQKASAHIGRYDISGAVGIKNMAIYRPENYVLYQNYPNPFNPTTTIGYQLSAASFVNLTIYNALGQKIKTLVSEQQPPGNYQVEWDASGFSGGIYFYKLETSGNVLARKMLLIK